MELKEFLEIVADIKEVKRPHSELLKLIHSFNFHFAFISPELVQAGWAVKRVRENEKISDQARDHCHLKVMYTEILIHKTKLITDRQYCQGSAACV